MERGRSLFLRSFVAADVLILRARGGLGLNAHGSLLRDADVDKHNGLVHADDVERAVLDTLRDKDVGRIVDLDDVIVIGQLAVGIKFIKFLIAEQINPLVKGMDVGGRTEDFGALNDRGSEGQNRIRKVMAGAGDHGLRDRGVNGLPACKLNNIFFANDVLGQFHFALLLKKHSIEFLLIYVIKSAAACQQPRGI